MDDFHLTLDEAKDAYYSAWAAPTPHFDGMEAIAQAATTKIIRWIGENSNPISEDWGHTSGWEIKDEAYKALLNELIKPMIVPDPHISAHAEWGKVVEAAVEAAGKYQEGEEGEKKT